jgi:hypothetical protein
MFNIYLLLLFVGLKWYGETEVCKKHICEDKNVSGVTLKYIKLVLCQNKGITGLNIKVQRDVTLHLYHSKVDYNDVISQCYNKDMM